VTICFSILLKNLFFNPVVFKSGALTKMKLLE